MALGDRELGMRHYKQALKVDPNHCPAMQRLADAYREGHEPDQAIPLYQKALQIQPDNNAAIHGLGLAIRDIGKPGGAMARFRKVLGQHPDFLQARHQLGKTLMLLGRHEEAVEAFQKVLETEPEAAEVHASLVLALDRAPHTDTAAQQAARLKWAGEHLADIPAFTPHDNDPAPGRILRVGYVLTDFAYHAATLGAALVHYDSDRFEVVIFSDDPPNEEGLDAFQSQVKLWRTIHGKNDEAVAALVREEKIDILVDLQGHSGRSRLGLFARRCRWRPGVIIPAQPCAPWMPCSAMP